MTFEDMSVDNMSLKMTVKMTIDIITVDEMSLGNILVNKMTVDKMAVGKIIMTK